MKKRYMNVVEDYLYDKGYDFKQEDDQFLFLVHSREKEVLTDYIRFHVLVSDRGAYIRCKALEFRVNDEHGQRDKVMKYLNIINHNASEVCFSINVESGSVSASCFLDGTVVGLNELRMDHAVKRVMRYYEKFFNGVVMLNSIDIDPNVVYENIIAE